MRFSKSRRSRFFRRNSVIVPSSLLDASWLSDQSYFVKELFSTYLRCPSEHFLQRNERLRTRPPQRWQR